MKNAVLVYNSGGRYAKEGRKIKTLAGRLPKSVKTNLVFEVCLVSDREMRELNRKFRRKDRVTNVLSFCADGGPSRPDLGENVRYLGEIFLAPDHIRSRGENLGFLFIHGFLHLSGYTHGGKSDKIRMEKAEKRLSRRLKI
jgi:probable rRNA maturation factor